MFHVCLLAFSTFLILQAQCRNLVSSPGCIHCQGSICPTEEDCVYGRVNDECSCCDDGICAKGSGENCGGRWNLAGTCAVDLKCVPQYPRFRQMPGICEAVKEQNLNIL